MIRICWRIIRTQTLSSLSKVTIYKFHLMTSLAEEMERTWV